MTPIKCFLVEPTDRIQRYLRRYADGICPLMPGEYSRHDVMKPLDVVYETKHPAGHERRAPSFEHDHPAWPRACGCGYAFKPEDNWQCFTDRVYRRAETGEVWTLRTVPPGAMWHSPWQAHFGSGADGLSLVVRCPCGTDWHIDGMANNCTMKEDWKQEKHHCWVREGVPPNITVGKGGPTCAAGAGSIQTPKWHGFLRGGYLVE